MQNIIKHKRLSSISILLVIFLVIVGVMMFINKPKDAKAVTMNFEEISWLFAPFGVAPDHYVQAMFFNNFCSVPAPTILKVFNADNGNQVVSDPLGNIEPGEGAIRTFFDQEIPHPRRNVVARIESKCPRQSIICNDAKEFTADSIKQSVTSIEIAEFEKEATTARIGAAFVLLDITDGKGRDITDGETSICHGPTRSPPSKP